MADKKQKKNTHPEQTQAEREEKKAQREYEPEAEGSEETKSDAVDEKSGGEAETELSDASVEEPAAKPFPVVGIGASAGGIEALESFFENVPKKNGLAFVVITHTDPKHQSLLPSIIDRKTGASVKLVKEGMPVEPDTVYLPPSDRDPVIENDTFHLKKRPARQALHMPVDQFFRSLAALRGDRAGCVILSGTGTDGTHGLRAIKEKSGLGMVQKPETARHTGMPTSAIDTGLVDYILPPAEMPRQLIEYFEQAPALRPAPEKPVKKKKKASEPLNQILALLANRTRHDFTSYKNGTLSRRISRRIAVTHCKDASEYLKLLHRDNGEVRSLFQDLLIGVTNFFRDPDAWAFLKSQVMKELALDNERNRSLRVWVPGCATGEEAFSAAIIFKECLEENNVSRDMQIFGTDIDPKAIEKARNGKYLPNIAADVDAERLRRFFVKEGDRYRVKREIREPVIFAEQNILRDPPFSDLDLLICRNLLIYLKTDAQSRLIPLFHYTLRKNGILFLGESETIGRYADLFTPMSKTHSIFRKNETHVRPQVQFPTGKIDASEGISEEFKKATPADKQPDMEQAVRSVLLEEFTPPAVVVSKSGEILYTQGRTGKYLELSGGKPKLDIADMAREGLRFSLLSAIRCARKEATTIREEGLRVKTNGGYQWIDLVVQSFERPPLKDAMMVVFEELPSPKETAKVPEKEGQASAQDRVEELEQELVRVRQDYRSTMEELETSNEELRSSNEEMQSSNEELQSTNEELESSREELQSLNEELSTVNNELQSKMEEVEEANAAITHVLNSTHIALIFLDGELRVRRFTDEAARLVNLIETDVGRPLGHISNKLVQAGLSEKAGQVLKSLVPIEEEVKTEDGHWYRMNIMVYRKEKRVIEGVVLTFVNIDKQKKVQQQIEEEAKKNLQSAKRFAESIVDTVRESLLVLDEDLRVVTANRRYYENFQTDPNKTEGRLLFDLGDGQFDIPELHHLLKKICEEQESFGDYEVEHMFPKIGAKKMLLNGRHLEEEDRSLNKILLAIEDVTEKGGK